MAARFEVVYYPGETDERMPEWKVVEWTYHNAETGARAGYKVWSTYDMEGGEAEANEICAVMQAEYNMQMAEELA